MPRFHLYCSPGPGCTGLASTCRARCAVRLLCCCVVLMSEFVLYVGFSGDALACDVYYLLHDLHLHRYLQVLNHGLNCA